MIIIMIITIIPKINISQAFANAIDPSVDILTLLSNNNNINNTTNSNNKTNNNTMNSNSFFN